MGFSRQKKTQSYLQKRVFDVRGYCPLVLSEAHLNEKTAFAAFPSQQEGSELAFCVNNCKDCSKRAKFCQVSSEYDRFVGTINDQKKY